ncbi:hypothetical protein DID77_02430 [Candidatus Marinamargulisbacteria bacterium SCGC AG-439-L15]|nr:hypothetical protein DID77_02430 [Candidatus Marinamargulisbacteria bacterium SCGC AG-439-L15]
MLLIPEDNVTSSKLLKKVTQFKAASQDSIKSLSTSTLIQSVENASVIIALDLSRSTQFGSQGISKRAVAAKIGTLLSFAAQKNGSGIGVLLFSTKIEKYIPPNTDEDKLHMLITYMMAYKSKHKPTNISHALHYLSHNKIPSSTVFFLSDFMDTNYIENLNKCCQKHTLIPIVIEDPREKELPSVGRVTLEDPETGEQVVIDTNDMDIKQRFSNLILSQTLEKDRYLKNAGLSPIYIDNSQDLIGQLQHQLNTPTLSQKHAV